MDAVAPQLPRGSAPTLRRDTRAAIAALESYRTWLRGQLPAMPEDVAVGRDAYLRFLREVALIPFTPEELLAMATAGRDRLAQLKRFDMGGFLPRPEWVREMRRYGVLPQDAVKEIEG